MRPTISDSYVLLPFLTRIVICAFLVAGCATEAALPEASISLSKSKCLGSCPAYTMELYSDGRYVWNGRAHISVEGTQRGRLNVEAYRQALRLISRADIESFHDKYEAGPDCATWTTDQQTVAIRIRNGSKVKTIVHYLGCQGFPRQDDLRRLENGLEEAMHIRDFVQ